MRLPSKLEKLRNGLGRSRKVIAELVGDVSDSTVRRWEEGKAIPDLREAAMLAKAFKVSLDYLADDSLDEPPAPLTPVEDEILRLSRKMGLDLAMERLSLVPRGAAGFRLGDEPTRPRE